MTPASGGASPAKLGALAIACSLALVASASNARDASRVHRLLFGPVPSLSACAGLNANNDYRARISFPKNPELAFRARLSGGIGQAPASDARGNLIIVHSEPRLSKVDAKGRLLWTERLPSEAAAAPVLTSRGSVLIVTRDAEARLYSATGKLEATRTLPILDPKRRTTVIPISSGGVLVASGSDLLELDQDAQIVRKTRARSNITALAESGGSLVAVGENGTVEFARETGDFELVGSFGGSVPDGAAVRDGKVWAVVDAHKWLLLELFTGAVKTLATDSTLTLAGPAALFESGVAALLADDGFVSLRGADGAELSRVPISAPDMPFDLAQRERGLHRARLIGDDKGNIAVVQAGNDALVIGTDGRVLRLDGTSCLDPFRPTPTPGGLVFTCRSGQMFGVTDKGRSQP